MDDEFLYPWIVGRSPVPTEMNGPVMRRLQAFLRDEVAAEVAKGIG